MAGTVLYIDAVDQRVGGKLDGWLTRLLPIGKDAAFGEHSQPDLSGYALCAGALAQQRYLEYGRISRYPFIGYKDIDRIGIAEIPVTISKSKCYISAVLIKIALLHNILADGDKVDYRLDRVFRRL